MLPKTGGKEGGKRQSMTKYCQKSHFFWPTYPLAPKEDDNDIIRDGRSNDCKG